MVRAIIADTPALCGARSLPLPHRSYGATIWYCPPIPSRGSIYASPFATRHFRLAERSKLLSSFDFFSPHRVSPSHTFFSLPMSLLRRAASFYAGSAQPGIVEFRVVLPHISTRRDWYIPPPLDFPASLFCCPSGLCSWTHLQCSWLLLRPFRASSSHICADFLAPPVAFVNFLFTPSFLFTIPTPRQPFAISAFFSCFSQKAVLCPTCSSFTYTPRLTDFFDPPWLLFLPLRCCLPKPHLPLSPSP